MNRILGLLVVLSLCLVPHSAAAPKPDADAACGAISLTLALVGQTPPPVQYTFHIAMNGATGPYLLYYSFLHGAGTYKGCSLGTAMDSQFGPFVGNIDTTFNVDSPADMAGWWQCLSATQTSNVVHLGP